VFFSWLLIGHLAGTHVAIIWYLECTYFLAILFDSIANIYRAQGVHGIQHGVERTRRRAEGKLQCNEAALQC
jgi:hypothetical protein